MVRAKFKVTHIDRSVGSGIKKDADGKDIIDPGTGRPTYAQMEMRTVIMHPVYSSEPGTENKKFWDATPSGELRLGTVNPSAWEYFELDKEYYVDFSPVEG